MNRDTTLLIGVGAGFLVVPLMAGAAPTVVNGFLVLLLVGVILMRSDSWLPWLTTFSSAFAQPKTVAHPSDYGRGK